MVIGCNGRDASTQHATPPLSWWDNKLGSPLSPPKTVNGIVSRSFTSGVNVWYDLTNKTGGIDGWEPAASWVAPSANSSG